MFNQKLVCIFLTLLMVISTSFTVMTTNKHTDSSSEIKSLDEARMTHSESDRCADHPLIENTIVSSAESTLFYDNEEMLWNGTQEISPNSGWSDFSNANATWIWPYIQAPGTYDFIHHFTLQSGAYDVEFHWSGLTDDAFIPSSGTDYFTSMQDESTGELSLVHISLAGGYSASTIPYDTTNHPNLTSVSNLEYDAGTGILYGTAYDDANSELEFVSIDTTNGLVSSIGTMPHADSGMSTFGGSDYFTSMQDESTGELSLVHISLAGGYSSSTIPYDTTNHPDLTSVSNLEYDAGTGILYGTAYEDANSELEFVSIDITNGLVSSIGTMPHVDSGMSTFGGSDYFTSMQDESTGEFSLVHISLAGGYSASTIPYDTTNHPDLTSVSNLEYDAGTGILYGSAWDDVNSELEFVSIDITNGLVSSIGTMPHADSGMSTFGGFSASVSIASNMNWIMDIADPPYSSSNPDHYDEIELGTGEIQGVPDSLNLSLQITARNRNSSSGSTTPGGLIYDLDISYCVNPDLSDVDGDGVPDDEDAFIWNPYEWNDTDYDHIGDNSDICPDTPLGEMSDGDGCSMSQLGIPGIPEIDYLEIPFYDYYPLENDIEFFPSIEHFIYHPVDDVNVTIELTDAELFDEWMELTGNKEEQALAENGQAFEEVGEPPEGMLSERSLSLPVEVILMSIVLFEGITSITDTDMIPPPQVTSYATSDVNPNSVRAKDVHRATDAWAAGIDGTGINVGIADTGVDFSNPALQGTQARVTDASSPYHGWPIMYDENGMDTWLSSGRYENGYADTSSVDRDDIPASSSWLPDGDGILDTKFSVVNLIGGSGYGYYNHHHATVSSGAGSGMIVQVHTGNSGVVDKVTIVESGSGYSAGDIITITDNHPDGTPWGNKVHASGQPGSPPVDHTGHSHGNNDAHFELQGWMVGYGLSKSGNYHFGSRHVIGVGTVNILVTDYSTSGVYDTVIVDLNKNYDFTDDHKMVKGSEAGGYAIWGQGDSIWDVSSGMIYWISDGVNGVPYGDVRAAATGKLNRIAGAGDLVLFMEGGLGDGSHGTLCASAVAGQGNLNDGMGQGMAPGAKIIATWSHGDPSSSGGGGVLGTKNNHFFYRGYDGIPNTGDEADITSYSLTAVGNEGKDTGEYLTEFAATGNSGPFTSLANKPNHMIMVGGYTSLELENGGGTWGSPWQSSSRYVSSSNFEPNPHVVTVGFYHGDGEALNIGAYNGYMAYNRWHGTSLASPLAAGIGALAMQAYNDEYGQNPTSTQLRDILMSSAQNTGLDTYTQGGGFLDAKRAIDAIRGDNHAISVEPALSTSIKLPGDHGSDVFTLTNNGDEEVSVTVTPSELMPLDHEHILWEMDGAEASFDMPGFISGWDGNASGPIWFNDGGFKYGDVKYPDMIIPIHIEGDSNTQLPLETTVVRARAATALDSSGFVKNKMNFIRWTDVDGDGKWMDDQLGDGLIIDHQNEWTESDNEFSFLDVTLSRATSLTYVANPLGVGEDGILLAVWRDSSTYCEVTEYCALDIDITAFGYEDSRYLSLTPPPEDTSDGGGAAARSSVSETFQISANSQHDLTIYQDIPHSITPDIIQHGVMIHSSGAGIGGSVNNRDWFLPIITVIAFDGTYDQDAMIVDHDIEDQKLYSIHWLTGESVGSDSASRRFVANVSGFSPDGIFSGTGWGSKVNNEGLLFGETGHGGGIDTSYSSHLHYYGPITKHLEDTDPGGPYPYASKQYLGTTDPQHFSTTVSDVSISNAKTRNMIFEKQEATQDIVAKYSTATFSWHESQFLIKGETYEYELECEDSSDYLRLWLIEDDGDGVFDPGTRGSSGIKGDLYDPDMIDIGFNHQMRIKHGNPVQVDYLSGLNPGTQYPLVPSHPSGTKFIGNEHHLDYRPYKHIGCLYDSLEYQAKYTGVHWLAVQGGVYGQSLNLIGGGIGEFNVHKITQQVGYLSILNWNMLNPFTTTTPWDADMGGIGNGVVNHVLEVEISHQDTSAILRADVIVAEIVVEMSNGKKLSFPYTFHIEYVESVAGDVDPDDVLLPPDDDTVDAVEEDSGFLGLPGFEMATMLLAMLSAAFVGRRKKYG